MPDKKYKFLLNMFSEEDLDKKINEKIAEFGGFLTREAAITLLWKEAGGKSQPTTIAEIKSNPHNDNVNLKARVKSIGALRTFETGTKLKKVVLEDETGEITLNLWNEDLNQAKTLGIGDVVLLSNTYIKNQEINLGYRGKIEILEKPNDKKLNQLKEPLKQCNIEGVVAKIRHEQKRSILLLKDESASIELAIWNDPRALKLSEGAYVRFENVRFDGTSCHVNQSSRILVKRKIEGIEGVLTDLVWRGDKAEVKINDETFTFSKEETEALLNIHVKPGIKMETIIELKKRYLIGKDVFLTIQNQKPILIIR